MKELRALLLALVALVGLAGLVGCKGTGVKAGCTKNPDGSISCSIEAHKHE